MNNKKCKTLMRGLMYLFILSLGMSGIVACVDNDFEDTNYYTATKRTAAQLIEDEPGRYSQFQALLQRAGYFNLLSTYGNFTVFAPDNNAINTYLAESGYGTIENIPMATCDTIARTHIVDKGAFFTTDYSDGALPEMNMDDRYLVLSSDSDVNNNNALVLYVNKRSRIIQKDDSVTNGVVHTINRVLSASNLFLPDLMESDSTITLFTQALKATNLTDSLTKFMDYTYACSADSISGSPNAPTVHYGGRDMPAYFPEKRFYKFTAFVEPDSIYHKNGIYTLEDLKAYAKRIYDASFPEDAGLYDNDPTNRKNPLNRFVSYHLMDRLGNYDDWAPSGTILEQCCRTDIADAEDFWQTMCPDAMLRFCRAAGGLYANRKGLKTSYKAGCRGVKVLSASESGKHDQNAINGVYHYLDDILAYTTTVRDVVLNCRMRIDATTLSPDFMNQGGRGHCGYQKEFVTAFKNGYIGNWKTSPETFIAVHPDDVWWSSYLGNAICVKGQYDVQIKLPTPPPGLYEIRLGYVAGEERGVVQVYFNNEPCGIPVDLRIGAWGTEVGYEADTEDEDHNTANDKAMRNRGYMKGMDSYGKPGATNFRVDAPEHMRRILTTAQFKAGQENWLRFRQVMDGNVEWSFDYIELCPKSIYASPDGEDRH